MKLKEKLIKELSSKECQNFMKTMAILFGIMMFQTYFWIDWHYYIDDMAVSYDGVFVEDKQMNLLLLIGLLCLQWIPLYIMFRISFFISDVVSQKFGWYSDFITYMKKQEKK